MQNCILSVHTNIIIKNKPTINILHSLTENHNHYKLHRINYPEVEHDTKNTEPTKQSVFYR